MFLTGDVTFDTSIINVGNGMDIQSGYFTAPTSGYYYFSFSGTAYDVDQNNFVDIAAWKILGVVLLLNLQSLQI